MSLLGDVDVLNLCFGLKEFIYVVFDFVLLDHYEFTKTYFLHSMFEIEFLC